MSWITVVWSMNAAACLTLAAFYGAVWCKQRDNWMHLLFSCSAIAAAAISAFELWMINATTVELANEAARQARLTARSLEGADGVGDLKTALESLAMNVSQNCRLKSVVKANGTSSPISAPVSAQLYRQEAVRNAIEHGAARQVLIQLTFGDRDMVLTVQDDGAGFDTKTNGHGMGLRIMRYRAQCIGGSCEVHAGRTQGTIVHCRVPVETQHSVRAIL